MKYRFTFCGIRLCWFRCMRLSLFRHQCFFLGDSVYPNFRHSCFSLSFFLQWPWWRKGYGFGRKNQGLTGNDKVEPWRRLGFSFGQRFYTGFLLYFFVICLQAYGCPFFTRISLKFLANTVQYR